MLGVHVLFCIGIYWESRIAPFWYSEVDGTGYRIHVYLVLGYSTLEHTLKAPLEYIHDDPNRPFAYSSFVKLGMVEIRSKNQ
jgi:hypothetical protein